MARKRSKNQPPKADREQTAESSPEQGIPAEAAAEPADEGGEPRAASELHIAPQDPEDALPEPQQAPAEPPPEVPEIAEPIFVDQPSDQPEVTDTESTDAEEPTVEPATEIPAADSEPVVSVDELTAAATADELGEDADEPAVEEPPQEVTTERVIEAVLFVSEAPLTLSKLVSILSTAESQISSAREVRDHIKALNRRYQKTGASFRIEKIAGGYQMLTLPVYNTWIRKLKQSRQDSRLSQAALETLAVVAYKQPVIRAEIESIRGVAAGEMLNRLRELGLIKIVGRAEDVGRPILYGTTKRFLEAFGLGDLEDLPEVEELKSGNDQG